MELNDDFKNIIKNYLKAKKYKDNKQKFIIYLERIILLLNKENLSEESDTNKEYIKSIKEYTYTNITNLINNSLIKNNKIANKNIFDLINQGNLEHITDTENVYNYQIYNDEGLTPLHRCVNLGDTTILKEFLKKGEKIDLVNKSGHTLLEYACLEKDPNVILFLLNHGADMKKHLYFRDKMKVHLKLNDIDTACLMKLCLNQVENDEIIDLNFLYNYVKKEKEIGIDDLTFEDLVNSLSNLLLKLSKEKQETIISIWKEELSYQIKNNLGCPNNYIEIILFNLVPFIDYPFNLSNRNILTNELIFLIKHLSLKNNFVLDLEFNKSLINKLWKDYKDIIPYDYLGVIIHHIFSKVKN